MELKPHKTTGGAVRCSFLALLLGVGLWLGELPGLAFSIGERVQAIAAVNVRETPAGVFMITRRIGDQATVLEGPVVATLNGNVLNWFKVNFDVGGTNRNPGWVAEIGLASIGIQPGNPLNPGPGTQTNPGVLLASNTVTLTWLGVPEASFYDLGVFDTGTGAAVTNMFVYLAGYATNDSMVTNWSFKVTLSPGREYRWNVAACNPVGSSAYTPVLFFRSPAAFLTVARSIIQPPAAQTGAEIQSNGFVLDLALEVGRAFRVQASSDLQTWTDVTNFVSAVPAVQFVDVAAKPLSRRFYRIVSP